MTEVVVLQMITCLGVVGVLLSRLVEECLDPPRGERDRPTPIVLVGGTEGSSRAEVLRAMESRFAAGRPRAHCSPGALPRSARAYDVADLVASQLEDRVGGFGRLRFPRLTVGLLALQITAGRPAAGGELRKTLVERTLSAGEKESLRRWRATLPQAADAAASATAAAGLAVVAPEIVRAAVDGLVALVGETWMRRRPGVSWYAQGYRPVGQPGFDDGTDALAAMITRAKSDEPAAREEVDLTLCRAFLADVGGEWSRARALWESTRNGIVLIERGDTKPFIDFLAALAQLRDQRIRLLVVAGTAGRVELPDTLARNTPPREAELASYADWKAGRDRWGACYPVEVDRPRPRNAREVWRASFVARLARGHPGAIALIEAARDRGGPEVDRRRLLDTPVAADGTLLGDALCELVTKQWRPPAIEVLARAAAARTLSETDRGAAASAYLPANPALMREFGEQDLWVVEPEVDADAGPPELHPLARRALLHRLGRVPDVNARSWDKTHAALGAAAQQRGDLASDLHHRLACGDIAAVALALGEALAGGDAAGWCHLFEAVVAAPIRFPGVADGAEAHCLALAGPDPDEGPVPRRLVAAAQLHADVLGDPRHELCLIVANDLRALSQKAGAGIFAIQDHAARYDDCHTHWHPHEPIAPEEDR